ncbi:hypothetical protein HNQ64_001789 [Prosthecobacter dejongeii]|uniref:Uncharacterized protein n=1 Tax=Prosthecobacter dejongeii TaxID=48465 RepID=A0A7W7YJT3_9BACT|nr:hypothetical protein [Prosthecobacter dejongeii]
MKTVMEGLLNIVGVCMGRMFAKIEAWNNSLRAKLESIRDKLEY